MKFELPIASRQRLDELLEYLGDRAEDFKKCFDIESEWCWKYADLVLRGISLCNPAEYAEIHHIVPCAYYRKVHNITSRKCKAVIESNLTVISAAEHIYAHFLMAMCALPFMKKPLSIAANAMIFGHKRGRLEASDSMVIKLIPTLEAHRIRENILSKPEDKKRRMNENSRKYQRNKRAAGYRLITDANGKRKFVKCTGQAKNARKPIAKIDMANGNVISVYKNAADASRDTGIHKAQILNTCQGRQNSSHGYDWKYIDPSGKLMYPTMEEVVTGKACAKQARRKQYNKNKDKERQRALDRVNEKIARGYRHRVNPMTGKKEWVFVGINAPTIDKRKKVHQFNKVGELLNTFDSCSDAARFIGTGSSSIVANCKGKQATCLGYIFKYADAE